jgi:hypothetical protein
VWAREFGTETTENTGNSFSGELGAATINRVDARTGFLEISQLNGDADEDSINGTTFLFPEWSSFPPSPIFGDQPDDPRAICLYAHVLLKENLPFDGPTQGMLMLAGESFTGDVGNQQCTGIGIAGDNSPEEHSATVLEWQNGAGSEPQGETAPHWGSNLYFRVVMLGDDTKETDYISWISRDGLSWSGFAGGSVLADGEACRRVGLGISSPGIAYLDWMRIYAYPLAGESGGFLTPDFPLTGDRRY